MPKKDRKKTDFMNIPSAVEAAKSISPQEPQNLTQQAAGGDKSMIPKEVVGSGKVTIGGKTYDKEKDKEEYEKARLQSYFLQTGDIGKLREMAGKENLKNWIAQQLGGGIPYSEVIKKIERGEIGDQPQLLSKEQLESEMKPQEEAVPFEMQMKSATPFAQKPGEAIKTQMASILQMADLSKQWARQIPGVGGIFGRGGASTVVNVQERWDASARILNENVAKVKTGDIRYQDVLNSIEDAQGAMIQYEGYIHGMGQADPDYRIDNGLAMEQKLKQYQNALEAYKLEVVAAENARRTSIANFENQALFGGLK